MTTPTVEELESDPLFPITEAGDGAARLVDTKPAKTAKAAPDAPDPEAPFGWMDDPKAPGGRRPKRAPGRQRSGAVKSTPPPANRKANPAQAADKATPKPSEIPGMPDRSVPEKVGDIVDGVRMVTMALPVLDVSVMGQHLGSLAKRIKAQGIVLRESRTELVQAGTLFATNVPVVGRAVDSMSSPASAGWLIPACLTVLPIVMASVALWKSPIADLEGMVAASDAEFASLIKSAMPEPVAAPPTIEPANVDHGV